MRNNFYNFVKLLLLLLVVAGYPRFVLAVETLTIGVHAHYPDDTLSKGWRQLEQALTQMVPSYRVKIVELDNDELERELRYHRLDFVLTDPALYVQLKERNVLARAVATVRGGRNGKPVFAMAGAIIVRADREDISSLHDLRNKRVAIESREELGSFQSQAHILFEAGIDVETDLRIVKSPSRNEYSVIRSVLSGEADAAFVGAGVVERLAAEGHFNLADVKVINRQDYPGYPFSVSTRLYPERPLVMLPHVAPYVAQELVTALYKFERGSPLLEAVGLYHLKLPDDYGSVTNLARELRLPPFDMELQLTLEDIWQRYAIWMVIFLSAVIFISLLALGLNISNRRLQREINERQSAENSLKKSEQNLAESQKIAHLGNWVMDLKENHLLWSEEVFNIFELDAESIEPSYELFIEAIHPDDRKLVNDTFTHSVENAEPYSIEHRLLLKSGIIKYVHERGETFYDDEGKPISSVGTVLDITERKLAEQKIAAANDRFELAMQASNDGLWDWDVITNHVYYSPRWKEMLGYQQHELENKFSTWENLVDDEDRKVVGEHIRRCLSGQQSGFEAEFRMRHKDGRWRDLLSRGIAVRNSEGEVTRFVGTHVDITDRKQLERSLREQERELNTILDQLPSILFVKEAKDLRYVRFNRRGEEMLGLEHGYFLGKNDYDLFPASMADEFTQDDRIALQSSSPIEIAEEIIDTPSGQRIMHTRKVAIKGDHGEPVYLLGISEDITEQKAAQVEHERLQRELQQAQKMESLGQLTGGIAHDFNNLLAIINGYAGLAFDNCLSRGEDKLAGYMNHLKEASDRATNLVAQMLAFSRSEQAEDMPIHFAPLIKEDIKMLRATLPTSIEIKSEVIAGLPPVVMNPTQLHQILMNLSINARDAMRGVGCLTIHLGWARELDTVSPISHKPVKGDWIELCVSDTGSGIDAQTAKKIFNPFFTTKEVGKGTGMGLSVIYGIMENHLGHILLESEEGKGTTFRMLFRPHLDDIAGMQPQQNDETLNLPQGDGSEILVVDDELSLGVFMAELLKSNGYRATAIADSRAALELFRQEPERFAMLITDQTMPNITGTELIAAIRETHPDFPVILCTGYSDKIDAIGANEMNIPYFEKPVNEVKLMLRIAEILHPDGE
jgi:PAS domain S-box-containing protein